MRRSVETTAQEVGQKLSPYRGRTGETPFLAVLDRSDVLFVACAVSPSPVVAVSRAGSREPLRATASGQVLLAWEGATVVERLLSADLHTYTGSTLTDRAELIRELEGVRQAGYATCWDEQFAGVSGLSVPIRFGDAAPVPAIILAPPSIRLNQDNFAETIGDLQKVVGEVKDGVVGTHTTR